MEVLLTGLVQLGIEIVPSRAQGMTNISIGQSRQSIGGITHEHRPKPEETE